MYSLTLLWTELPKEYNITEGVKIVDHYTKGCFLFCNANESIHYITIEYNQNYIKNVYEEHGIIKITSRDEYKFCGRKSKRYITFKLNTDDLEININ
jgi:hypothetical protein